MAKKPPVQVHVQSSDFRSLLDAQKASLQSLQSIETIMKQVRLTELANLMETKKIDDENDKEIKIAEEDAKVQREQLKVSKQMADNIKKMKEAQKEKTEESEAIANIAKSMQTFKTISERFQDSIKKIKETFSPSGLKTSLLKTFNVGGVFNKAIEREKFIKTQRALGSEKTKTELKQDFEKAQVAAKDTKKAQKEIDEYRKLTGLSEADMAKYAPGKKLLEKREMATDEYAKYDIRAAQLKQKDQEPVLSTKYVGEDLKQKSEDITPTQAFADSGAAEEAAIENQKMVKEQSDLLVKIEQNTRGESPDQKAKPKEEESKGGGLLGSLLGGGGAGKALKSLKDFGVGIVLVAGALWVASKAFQSFAEVEWENVGKGLVALGGLVLAAIGLDKVKGQIIAGAAGLGLLALATWGIGKALMTFQELDWETIGKGFVALAGIGVIGAIAGAAAPLLIAGAAGLGLMGGAIMLIGNGMKEVGENIDAFIQAMEKLGQIDASNVLLLGGALAGLGVGMAAFAAGNALAGMSNLVSGLLSAVTGQKSPVDKLIEIGKSGEGVEKAGTGMKMLGEAMKSFSGIKKDDLKALDAFPWEKATKFVAAGGAMSANGSTVYNQSKANADEGAKASESSSGNTAVINAPVNNVTRQTQIIKPQIRNQESSQSRYISSRYGVI